LISNINIASDIQKLYFIPKMPSSLNSDPVTTRWVPYFLLLTSVNRLAIYRKTQAPVLNPVVEFIRNNKHPRHYLLFISLYIIVAIIQNFFLSEPGL